MSLILTLGLARCQSGQIRTPLLLSLSSWDPIVESFSAWFERQAIATYPSLAQVTTTEERTLLNKVSQMSDVIIVLDDADELPVGSQTEAIRRINEDFPADRPLILFSRTCNAELADLDGVSVFRILRPTVFDVGRYIATLASEKNQESDWSSVLGKLQDQNPGDLAVVLQSPLFLRLAWSLCSARRGLKPAALLTLADTRGHRAVEDVLLDEHIRHALLRKKILRSKRAKGWLEFIAFELQKRGARNLSWWKLHESAEVAVIAAAGLMLAPAYGLALLLPAGLTRGFAIGITSALTIAMLRGINPSWTSAIVTALLGSGLVSLIGAASLGWRFALMDTAELGVPLLLVIAWKKYLIGSRSRAVIVITAVSIASAWSTQIAKMFGAIFPLGGRFFEVSLSIGLGVGVATLATRLLLPHPAGPLRPTRVEVRLRSGLGWPFGDLFRAILSATSVGIGAGVVGTIRESLPYGLHMVLVFGMIAGLPVGIVGGLIKWLNQPISSRASAGARTTFQNDRTMAIGSIVLVTVVSTISILVLHGPLESLIGYLSGSKLRVEPQHGFLFGLTIGTVVASYNSAWPTYFVAHAWLALRRALPWRYMTFLDALHRSEILRQNGPRYQFKHERLQERLSENWDATHQPRVGEAQLKP
jgi:hypothetical protein